MAGEGSGRPPGMVSRALSYAGVGEADDPAELRARTRADIISRWLPGIVDEVLASHEISGGVDQAGLDPDELRRQIHASEQDVLAGADKQLDRAVDATLDPKRYVSFVQAEPNRRAGRVTLWVAGVLGVVALCVAALPFVLSWAWWGTALMLIGAAAVGFVSFALFLVGRDDYLGKPRRTTVSADSALRTWRQACRDEGVLPFVRRLINERAAPAERFVLDITTKDAPGLSATGESEFMVDTGSVTAFQQVTDRLPTGAIGLAGPRGVGKTSLIEHIAGRATGDGTARRRLQVTVSAPVQYDPREFVLHLFASVCQTVLREREPASGRGWRVVGGIALLTAATVVLRIVGVLGTYVLNLMVTALIAATLSAMVGWLVAMRRRRADKEIFTLARKKLAEIRYLQAHTSGWSGKVTLPLRSEAGWSRQTQRERRAQTYPELVNALREFLATLAKYEGGTPAVIIAIDEVDKIESADRAQQFVNEIKGIFGAPGTQFLVAVSEDALASFERRGLPVRDAFDSAFHEIVRVDYLTLADTITLLKSRVLRLPDPFKWLVHCMSGGLPRDVVRTARAMVALTAPDEPPGLDEVCDALVADDVRRKSHAFQLACRDIGDSPDTTEFIRSLRRLPGDADTLLALVPKLRQDGDLAPLSRQAATYVYYSATLLEVFTRDRVDSGDKGTFDLLARAKQSLAVHPRLAWLQVDEFREAWHLPTVPVD